MVERELISRQMRGLVDMENSGLVPQLVQDKYGDLSRMYCLFRRVEGGVDLLRQVRPHLHELPGQPGCPAWGWGRGWRADGQRVGLPLQPLQLHSRRARRALHHASTPRHPLCLPASPSLLRPACRRWVTT